MKLLDQYVAMHKAGMFKGKSALKTFPAFAELFKRLECRDYLDYGCGAGWQYDKWHAHTDNGMPEPAWRYDPAVEAYREKPSRRRRFDAVFCSDVLEHVPETELGGVLYDLFSYANKLIVVTVCTRPAHKKLPNGMNCHVTVRPTQWWAQVFTLFLGVNYGLHVEMLVDGDPPPAVVKKEAA